MKLIKTSSISLIAISIALSLGSSAFAQDTKKKKQTELGKAMSGIAKNLGSLKKTYADKAKNADSVKIAAEIQALTIKTLPEVPGRITAIKVGGDPKAAEKLKRKKTLEYKTSMTQFLLLAIELEELFLNDKNNLVLDHLKKMYKMRSPGHKTFK